jgi:hypothetical protein
MFTAAKDNRGLKKNATCLSSGGWAFLAVQHKIFRLEKFLRINFGEDNKNGVNALGEIDSGKAIAAKWITCAI